MNDSESVISAPGPEPAKIPVRVPGLGVIHFPGTMSEGEIQARLADITQPQGAFRNAVGSAAEMLGKSALPAIGGAVGGMVAGPPGVAAGSMLGEGGNQALGITPPSGQDIVAAGVIPGVMGAIGKGAGAMVRRLPGAPFALHEMAAANLAARPGMLAPAQSSENLYALVAQHNPAIKADNLRAAAESLANTETGLSKGLANDEIRNVGQGLVSLIDQHSGEVPFQTLRTELRRLGDRAGSLSAPGSTGGETKGAYKLLVKSAHDDMEAAAANGSPAQPAVEALKQANAARKVEFAVDDLAELFSVKGGGISPRPDGAGVQVNFGTIIRKLEKDDSIRKSLGDAPYKELVDDLNVMWRKTPALGAVQGADAGSKNVLRQTGGMAGLGTMVGGYFYGGPGAAIGGGAGAAAGAYGPQIIARLVATKMGRSVLKGMLEGNRGVLTPEAIAVLGSAVGMSEPGREATHGVTDFARGVMQ